MRYIVFWLKCLPRDCLKINIAINCAFSSYHYDSVNLNDKLISGNGLLLPQLGRFLT